MNSHTKHWEDSGMVQVYCNGREANIIYSDEEPVPCDICGIMLKLKWDVEIIEVRS